MNKKLVIILAVVVLAGGGAGAWFAFLKPAPAAETAEAAEEKPKSPPGLISLDAFLVNVNDGQADRFAKVELALTIQPASMANKIQENALLKARMRDRILTLLTSKHYQELTSPIGKEGLRREVKAHLGPLFEDDEATIEDVLFDEFVVQ